MHTNSPHAVAVAATLHCLTGCAIGEITGMVLGEIFGLTNELTILLSFSLAFVFGYTLSVLPLVRGGLSFGGALRLVLAADTVSILTMELVDNAVMYAIPGAMGAGLVNPLFWVSMTVALFVAFWAAYPVNRYLIARGKGHALVHAQHDHSEHHHTHTTGHAEHHHTARHEQAPTHSMDNRQLLYAIIAFLLGGLVVSLAATTFDRGEYEHLRHAATISRLR